MLLLLSLLIFLAQSEIIINDTTPYVLAKLEKDTCYEVQLNMKVSCIVTTTTDHQHTGSTLALLYVDYGNNTKKFLYRFWNRHETFNRGRTVGNYIIHEQFTITNGTYFNPVLALEKGKNCADEQLIVNIYKLYATKIDCGIVAMQETLAKIGVYTIFTLIAILFSVIICAPISL